MIDKIGHIRNPLTVISIFAAVAEISGTTILPFIEPANQSTYVWFLMLFPTLLVGVFFITLNFNHKVLYAPSDYKNEDNFLKLFGKATAEEKEQKLREEVEESTPPAAIAEETIGSRLSDQVAEFKRPQESHREIMANVTLAERLSINKLSKELGISFRPDVKFETSSNRTIVFDALAIHKDKVHALEVKLFKNEYLTPMRLDRVLLESEIIVNQLKGIDSKEFILHFVAVLDNPEINKERVRDRLQKYLERYNVNVKLHVTTLNELQNEYQYNP